MLNSSVHISNEMEQYRGFVINEIDPIRGIVTFTNGESISSGDVSGDVSEKDMRRIQIRETILSHFVVITVNPVLNNPIFGG